MAALAIGAIFTAALLVGVVAGMVKAAFGYPRNTARVSYPRKHFTRNGHQ